MATILPAILLWPVIWLAILPAAMFEWPAISILYSGRSHDISENSMRSVAEKANENAFSTEIAYVWFLVIRLHIRRN